MPDEVEVIIQRRDRFLAGWSFSRIADELRDHGIPTPTSLRHWNVTTIRRILFNPTHAELVRVRKNERGGEHFGRRLFDPAQRDELLRLHKSRGKTMPTNTGRSDNTHSVTGLAKCGFCGSRLYVASPPVPPASR